MPSAFARCLKRFLAIFALTTLATLAPQALAQAPKPAAATPAAAKMAALDAPACLGCPQQPPALPQSGKHNATQASRPLKKPGGDSPTTAMTVIQLRTPGGLRRTPLSYASVAVVALLRRSTASRGMERRRRS